MENIENLKKIYLKTPIPKDLSDWEQVKTRLEEKPRLSLSTYFQKGAFAFAVVLISLTTVAVGAQAAKPGDTLFPVRVMSDQIKAKITNTPSVPVEKRAQDIIDVSKSPSPRLDQAVTAYQKALDKSTQEVNKNNVITQEENLKDTLSKQEQKLEEVKKKNPDSSKKLDEAINQTKKAQGEVKGASFNKGEDEKFINNPNQLNEAN